METGKNQVLIPGKKMILHNTHTQEAKVVKSCFFRKGLEKEGQERV